MRPARKGVAPVNVSPAPSVGEAPTPVPREVTETPGRKALTDRLVQLVSEMMLQIRPSVWVNASDIELTMHQFRAMSLLLMRPLRVTDIATLVGVRMSSATSLLDRLEGRGLIARSHDPEDRRVVWCRLTPKGIREADNLWQVRRGEMEGVARRLTDAELRAAVQVLETLVAALSRPDAPEAPPRRVA